MKRILFLFFFACVVLASCSGNKEITGKQNLSGKMILFHGDVEQDRWDINDEFMIVGNKFVIKKENGIYRIVVDIKKKQSKLEYSLNQTKTFYLEAMDADGEPVAKFDCMNPEKMNNVFINPSCSFVFEYAPTEDFDIKSVKSFVIKLDLKVRKFGDYGDRKSNYKSKYKEEDDDNKANKSGIYDPEEVDNILNEMEQLLKQYENKAVSDEELEATFDNLEMMNKFTVLSVKLADYELSDLQLFRLSELTLKFDLLAAKKMK